MKLVIWLVCYLNLGRVKYQLMNWRRLFCFWLQIMKSTWQFGRGGLSEVTKKMNITHTAERYIGVYNEA